MFSKKDLTRSKLKDIPPLAKAQPSLTSLKFYLSHAFLYEASRHIVKKVTKSFISTDWGDRAAEIREGKIDSVNNATLLAGFFERRNQEQIKSYVFMPQRSDPAPGQGPEHIAEWAAGRPGVTYLDVNEYLSSVKPKKQHIYFGDTHPSPEIHTIYATALFNHFISGVIE
ncbi:MAG: hypothetical protein HQ506_04610 [Candidatus Marinimicrobia bacterium]|nr:hypothetical protein [Candidatus Neomarinimicrobiota bacterium]